MSSATERRLANRQIDALRGKSRVDLVDEFAYPIPVTVISELLAVPPEDAPRFHAWAEEIIDGIDFDPRLGLQDRLELRPGRLTVFRDQDAPLQRQGLPRAVCRSAGLRLG